MIRVLLIKGTMIAIYIACMWTAIHFGLWLDLAVGRLWTLLLVMPPMLGIAIWIEIHDQRKGDVRRPIFRWHND